MIPLEGPIAIIGSGAIATASASLLSGARVDGRWNATVIDTRAPSRDVYQPRGVGVVGPLDRMSRQDLLDTASHYVLAFEPDDADHAVAAASRLLSENLSFRVMPSSLGCVYPLLRGLGWSKVPVARTRRSSRRVMAHIWQRSLDIVVASVSLALFAPLLAVVGALIRIESRGPMVFSQDRVGMHGRVFRILKLRTMVADAQQAQAEMTSECGSDPRFIKIECDPRVTRLGGILRKTSIDELPQLWNVLRGDMSLVGPRPSQPCEVERYEPHQFTRLLAKPGVTGMWQVSGRSALCFEDAVALDSAYVLEWSPWLDIKILFKTVAVVLQCRGAC